MSSQATTTTNIAAINESQSVQGENIKTAITNIKTVLTDLNRAATFSATFTSTVPSDINDNLNTLRLALITARIMNPS